MDIYVVQQGDTIDSIAIKFGITVEKLVMDNGISKPVMLVIGQTLVIAHPVQVYIVKEGDTLSEIAAAYQVTVMQLLRNNPQLADRKFIFPGETLVISYNTDKGDLLAVGYTYPFINETTLRKTLPSLTYLLIFNYRVTSDGELIGSDQDIAVIQTANLYGAATTLVLTSYSNIGEVNLEVVYAVLLSQQVQDKIVENILNILRTKGYNGVNLAVQFINTENQQLYLDFIKKIANILHPAGYSVFLTVNPGLTYKENEVTFEKIDYTSFNEVVDGILFLGYDWGYVERAPIPFSMITTSSFLDYIVTQIPLDKIRIVLPTLGYDWQLPYIPGQTKANALNFDSVLSLANQMNAVIHYDEVFLSAYFEYIDFNQKQHIVWFQDARSIDSSLKILKSYGIKGIGVWNIMYYFTQMWLVINTQYQIIKL